MKQHSLPKVFAHFNDFSLEFQKNKFFHPDFRLLFKAGSAVQINRFIILLFSVI